MKVIYYYHVPKCGGNFIVKNLKRLALKTPGKKYSNAIFLSCDRKVTRNWHNQPGPDASVIVKSIPNLDYEYVYVYHHHSNYGLKDIISEIEDVKKQVKDRGDEFYLFTCLREPIAFVNSHVNYNSARKLGAAWNFDAAIDASWFNNYQSKYLLYNHWVNWNIGTLPIRIDPSPIAMSREDVCVNQETVLEVLNIIDKIYITENMSILKTDLQKLLPNVDDYWDDKRRNVTTKRIIMTEEQKNQLIDKNQLDIWLYNKISNEQQNDNIKAD